MTYEEAKEELHKTAYKIVKLSSRPTDPFALRPGSGYLDVSPSGAAEVMVPGFLARSAVPLESRLMNLSFSPAQLLEAVTLTFRATRETRRILTPRLCPKSHCSNIECPLPSRSRVPLRGRRHRGHLGRRPRKHYAMGVDLPGSSDIVILVYSTKAFAASNPTGPRY